MATAHKSPLLESPANRAEMIEAALDLFRRTYPGVTFSSADIFPDITESEFLRRVYPHVDHFHPDTSVLLQVSCDLSWRNSSWSYEFRLKTGFGQKELFEQRLRESRHKNVVFLGDGTTDHFYMFFTPLVADRLTRVLSRDAAIRESAKLVNSLLETYESTLSIAAWLCNHCADKHSFVNLDETKNEVDPAALAGSHGLRVFEFSAITGTDKRPVASPKYEQALVMTLGSETQFMVVCGTTSSLDKYRRALFKVHD